MKHKVFTNWYLLSMLENRDELANLVRQEWEYAATHPDRRTWFAVLQTLKDLRTCLKSAFTGLTGTEHDRMGLPGLHDDIDTLRGIATRHYFKSVR